MSADKLMNNCTENTTVMQLSNNIWIKYTSNLYQCFSEVDYSSVVFSGRNQCYGHAGNRDECLIGSECKREKE